jgi:FtsZ-interacting cell division protein YlmF
MTYFHNPDAIADLNQFTLRKLAKTLVSAQGQFSWIWVQCNNIPLQEQIIQELKELCPVKWRELKLNATVRNLYQSISQNIGHQQPSALMVTGLENLQDLYSFATNLNFNQAEFRKNFQFPILIWINDDINKILKQYAPEARHNNIEPFHFEGEVTPPTIKQNTPSAFASTTKIKPPQAHFEEKMKQLSQPSTKAETFQENRIKLGQQPTATSAKPRQPTPVQPPQNTVSLHSPSLPKVMGTPPQAQSKTQSSFRSFNQTISTGIFSTPKLTRTPLNSTPKMLLLEPENSEEITDILDALRAEISVLINFSKMSPQEAQRSLDFLSGGTFAIDGDQARIGEQVFLFTPNCVKLMVGL